MIEYIYSKIDKNKLLHIYIDGVFDDSARINLTSEDTILQAARINLVEGKTFQAHKHLMTHRQIKGTAESWVVIKGNIEVYYYDLDDTLICTKLLGPGGCTITLFGGHNYKAITKASVYEFKNGPYMGVVADKVFINNVSDVSPETNCLNEKMKLPETNFFYDKALDVSKEIKDGINDYWTVDKFKSQNRRETWGEYDG
jgi:hypothetical protein